MIKYLPIETTSIIGSESIVCGKDTSEFVELEEFMEIRNSEIHKERNRIYEDIISDW